MADGGPLAVRLAPVPLRPWAAALVPLLLLTAAGLVTRNVVLSIVGLVGLVAGLGIQLGFSWSRNRRGPVMVLDQEGLLVRGHPRVAWSDVDKVVVSPIHVGGSRALSLLTTLQYGDVVAFVPKAGVAMPPPPGGLTRELNGWEKTRQSRYGTNLTVVASLFDVSPRQLARAAHRLGAVPVEGADA
ncbi:hypothetical protein SAMN05421756_10686 [Microlunatus flavus]|uniref:PH domain-containing protein n=1 Tax=Microlunatus flavus TaxID=1036181 RepID=A0A1H9J4C4_9ACTN|nr:hypothetical protein SAMN05421756_10686 [Microlunatus flavus]